MRPLSLPRPNGLGRSRGEWGRIVSVVGLIGSLVAAAWYVDDRNRRQVAREAQRIEARLERLEQRLDRRVADLTLAVRDANRRLDRLIEIQLDETEARR